MMNLCVTICYAAYGVSSCYVLSCSHSLSSSLSQSSAFDALERDFRDVLNELVGDKSLERFRLEYEKLHHTLKKSHENEVRHRLGCGGTSCSVMM